MFVDAREVMTHPATARAHRLELQLARDFRLQKHTHADFARLARVDFLHSSVSRATRPTSKPAFSLAAKVGPGK